MKIYYFSRYYNEERLIPYIFRHYDKIVNRYFIWDHQSTDQTRKLLKSNPKVTVFDLPGDEFDDYEHRDFKNNCWKEYDCDYVINVDADEFIYHSKLMQVLTNYYLYDIQIAKTIGFQMFTESLPFSNKQIYELIKTGIREPNYDKPIIFDPNIEPNFSFGAHTCEDNNFLWGLPEIKLLHYNILGPEFITKMLARNERLSERNKQEQLSYWPDEQGHRFNPYEYYEYVKQNAKEVI